MPLHRHRDEGSEKPLTLNPISAGPDSPGALPRLEMPETEMRPEVAARFVRDELLLDGSAQLNLATFVTTYMEPEAEELLALSASKNVVDKDEYPQTAELERRCVHMIAKLWHAPRAGSAIGCSTIGSSEAAMLAGLALKWRWRARRADSGAGADRPNLVMGINVQVCWEKFCRYFDVEARLVPMEGSRRMLSADEALRNCDESTIGVVAVLGSTQDGAYEPVAEIATALDRLATSGGPDVPLHVDAASGGFFAPFVQPELLWDFRLERVASINASGHKYGLVYPGVGWAIWRSHENLPEDLIFHVNYLGGSMPTFALNFSRPGAQVVGQYYELVRLGREGFRRVHQTSADIARWLAAEIASIGPFRLITDGSDLPVFVFELERSVTTYSVFDVSDALRGRGWQLPAYHFPAKLTHTAVLRIVVRNGFSWDMAALLVEDLRREVAELERRGRRRAAHDGAVGFHH